MAIVANWKQNGTGDRSVIVCDACHELIKTVAECICCIWPNGDDARPVRFVHSGRCDERLQQQEGRDHGNSLALELVLADLGSAMQIDWSIVAENTERIQQTWDAPSEDLPAR